MIVEQKELMYFSIPQEILKKILTGGL